MVPNTECMTIPEVASELRIAKSSVYKLIDRKELRGITVLGKKRVRRYDLQRYLESAGPRGSVG